MALQVWLPLNGNINNQGLDDGTFIFQGSIYPTVNANGKIGKCYEKVAAKQYGRLRSSKTYNLDGDITMACWANVTETVGDTANGLVTNHNHGDSSGVGINVKMISTTDFRISCNTGSGSSRTYNTYYGTTNIKGAWHHLALTYSKSAKQLKLWVDGSLEYTLDNYTNYSMANYIDIFSWSTSFAEGTYSPACKLNDIRIYDSCLSPKEIEILSRGLVCHYPLEGANNTLVPFGYQQLEYIESAGAAYFDTGYKFNPETDSFKVEFKGNDTANDGMILGSSGGKYTWMYYYGSNGIRMYASNGSQQQGIAGITSDTNKHIVEYKSKHYWADGVDKGSFSNTYVEEPNSMSMFSYGGASYVFKGRIYYCNICRNGKPQRVYIPAKRVSDSKIGMYDIINDTFKPSDSSTAFTAGDVVGTPSTVYDTSGFKNNGETYAYDTTGSIECSSDTARYSLSTFINSANVTNNATGIRYIYGNCELTTPQYLTVAFWCKPIAGYGGVGYANNGIFALTNNDIGTGAASDLNTAPMHNRDAGIDMCTSTNVHRIMNFTPTVNEWHHYAVVYDGRYGRAYKDGVQTSTLDMGSNLSLASFKAIVIGYSHAGGVYRKVQAYYSDFRLYATALSAAQVAELYNTAVSVANNGALMGYELVEV